MKKTLFAFLVAIAGLGSATSAMAVDGCQVMLCMAGNWRHITVCVPPVRKAMHDAALGRSWPTCHLSSGASAGTMAETSTPTSEATCPPMYSNYMDDDSGHHYVGCRFQGIVTVQKDGQPYTTLYWDAAGDSVTAFSDAAKTDLKGDYDPTYDNDLAAWLASHPTLPEPPVDGCPPHVLHCEAR